MNSNLLFVNISKRSWKFIYIGDVKKRGIYCLKDWGKKFQNVWELLSPYGLKKYVVQNFKSEGSKYKRNTLFKVFYLTSVSQNIKYHWNTFLHSHCYLRSSFCIYYHWKEMSNKCSQLKKIFPLKLIFMLKRSAIILLIFYCTIAEYEF